MTQTIHQDALVSAEFAKQISKIDDDLSEIVKEQMNSLQGSINALNNAEFLENIVHAKEAHAAWLNNLKKIVDEMTVYPIQTNSSKCAFGHFYHAVKVTHDSVVDDWKAIDEIHHQFHILGDKVIEAVKNENQSGANEFYGKAEKLSQEIFGNLDKVASSVESLSSQGIHLFGAVS
jgi:hypothetical protein